MLRKIYHTIIFIALLFLGASCTKQSNLPDLRESFSFADYRPFGTSLAYSILKKLYPTNTISINQKAINDNYDFRTIYSSLYINISRNFYTTEKDVDALLTFVSNGNTAFISANKFDTILLNRLNVSTNINSNIFGVTRFENTDVSFFENTPLPADKFGYYYFPLKKYFSFESKVNTKEIGINSIDSTNLFVHFWGKGRIYLHAEPRAFSNYFLLSNQNYLYWQNCLSLLPKNYNIIYWDNYYNKKNYNNGNNSDGSTFSEIFKHPPLKAAFWILLTLLGLYILFGMKRKQRQIPVIKPVENTSVAFAEAIAGLYLSKQDNKVIAEKMITYFNEQMRTKFFVTTVASDSTYPEVLSRKAAVPLPITKLLAQRINTISQTEKVSDAQLLYLNNAIENFFTHRN